MTLKIKMYEPKVDADNALLSRYDLQDALAYAMWDEDNHPFVPTSVRIVTQQASDGTLESLALVVGSDLNGPNKQPRQRVYSPSQTWRAPEWLHRMVQDSEDKFPKTEEK